MKNIKKYFIFSIVSAFLLPLNAMKKQTPNVKGVTITSEVRFPGIGPESFKDFNENFSKFNQNMDKFNQNMETQGPKLIYLIESHFFVGTLGLIGVTICLGFAACCFKSSLNNDKQNKTTMNVGSAVGILLTALSVGIIINRNEIAKYFSRN